MKKIKYFALFMLIISLIAKSVYADDSDDSDNDDVPQPVKGQQLSKDAINDMLLQSVSLMGVPYRWGGNTPQTGMDCSGFIRYVFKKSLGITLPRTANEMSKLGKRVDVDDLQAGDLLFFNIHHLNSHVGMYIGDDKFIQSPHTGDKIKISEFDSYWRAHLNGAKRIVAEGHDSDGNTTVEDYQYIDDEALPSGRTSHHLGHHHHKLSSKHSKGNHSSAKSGNATKHHVVRKSKHHKHKKSYSSD